MKSRQIDELQREISFLYRVTQSVHSLEIEEVLKEIVEIASEVSAAHACLVYVLNKHNELILRASKNPHPELLSKVKMKLGEGITGWVALEKKPVAISSGASKDSRFKLFRTLPEDRFEAFLSVPILTKRGVVGVINVQHQSAHVHSDTEINLLSAMGKLVGGAVENALLIEETLSLKEALELRKLIEKAKGIIMNKAHISEHDAHTLLQKESMKSGKSIRFVAEAVIIAEGLMK